MKGMQQPDSSRVKFVPSKPPQPPSVHRCPSRSRQSLLSHASWMCTAAPPRTESPTLKTKDRQPGLPFCSHPETERAGKTTNGLGHNHL